MASVDLSDIEDLVLSPPASAAKAPHVDVTKQKKRTTTTITTTKKHRNEEEEEEEEIKRDDDDSNNSTEEEDDEDDDDNDRRREGKVVPKNFQRLRRLHPTEAPVGDIPGVQKVHIRTWGCSHNSSDSEYMAGQLASYGYPIVANPDEADVWVLNSCTVKNPSQASFVHMIEEGKRKHKGLVLAGCVPEGQKTAPEIQGLSVIGVQQIDRVVEVVEETLKGNTVRLMGMRRENGRKAGGARLDLPKIRRNQFVEIIPINTGCLNQCTYCKTKHARGELGSYAPEEILDRVKTVIQEGVVEVWLTSEDTGAYGRDIGASLPDLLRRIADELPEGMMLRLGMTNPPYILDHLEAIADLMHHPRVYAFLHVPVQSGSDRVLNSMRREYTRKDFQLVVDTLRERVPGMTIATDIICGFPTETEDDFQKTLSLLSEYKFPIVHISQFYPRPGTPAALMDRLPTQEVKRRSRLVTQLFESYSTHDAEVGEEQTVWVTDVSADGEKLVGHNKSYQQVLIPYEEQLLGKMIRVKIVQATKYCLLGAIVPEASSETAPAPPVSASSVSAVSDSGAGGNTTQRRRAGNAQQSSSSSSATTSSSTSSSTSSGAGTTGSLPLRSSNGNGDDDDDDDEYRRNGNPGWQTTPSPPPMGRHSSSGKAPLHHNAVVLLIIAFVLVSLAIPAGLDPNTLSVSCFFVSIAIFYYRGQTGI